MNSKESTEFVEYFGQKGVFKPATSCIIKKYATTAPEKTLVRETIFKLNPIHVSKISQILLTH